MCFSEKTNKPGSLEEFGGKHYANEGKRVQARWSGNINTKTTQGSSLDWKHIQCSVTG